MESTPAAREDGTERRTDGAIHRIAVLCLANTAPERVIDYICEQVAAGVQVDLFVVDATAWLDLPAAPSLRMHALDDAEDRQLLLSLERGLLFTLPSALLRHTGRFVAWTRLGRPLMPAVVGLTRAQERLATIVHGRLFLPCYRIIRPRALARLFIKRLRRIDLTGVERIVAADIYSITLGWKLARRYPAAVATTALEK